MSFDDGFIDIYPIGSPSSWSVKVFFAKFEVEKRSEDMKQLPRLQKKEYQEWASNLRGQHVHWILSPTP